MFSASLCAALGACLRCEDGQDGNGSRSGKLGRYKNAVATILLIKKYKKWFLCFFLPFSFKIFINSREFGEEISFSSFFRKMLMSAFLLRSKANYLEKMHGNGQRLEMVVICNFP